MLPEIGSKKFTEYLGNLVKEGDPFRHPFYKETIEESKKMGVHLTGDDPSKLLDIQRPNESDEIKNYRLDVYRPKTKSAGAKAISIINRIYNPRLFAIEYNNTLKVPGIDDGEGIKDYVNGNIPFYKTLINWIKSVFTKMHLKDANGLLVIQPVEFDIPDDEYFEPIPYFFTAKELLDFKDNEYYTVGSFKKDQTSYSKNNEFIWRIAIYTKMSILVYEREKPGDPFKEEFNYEHNFDWCPAFRIGGVVKDSDLPILFESFIAGVLPHWDDALCWYSDLQAQIVNHLYPEKWEFTRKCTAKGCNNGKIKVPKAGDEKVLIDVDCRTCGGSGSVTVRSPYNVIQLNRSALNPDEQLPTPPGGYIQKDLDPTKLLREIAEDEIIKGFQAVNLFIEGPDDQAQSGIAKMIDRQDQDGTLSTYATHIFNWILPNAFKGMINWRYFAFLKNQKKVEEYMPSFKEPTSFDIYSINLILEELTTLKQAGVSGAVLIGLQKDIIEKRFTDKRIRNFLHNILDLDPLATLDPNQILANSAVIGREEQFIHAYIKDLLEMALEENPDFYELALSERKQKIRDLATQELNRIEVIEPEPQPGEQGTR